MGCLCRLCRQSLIPELEELFAETAVRGVGFEAGSPFGLRRKWLPDVELELEESPGLEEEVDRNSRGYVIWLQGALNRSALAGLNQDGIAGQRTQAAVAKFQQSAGLTPTGIVDQATEDALIRAGAGNPPNSSSSGGGQPTPSVDTVNVRGIVVARQIEGNVRALLEAADADGVKLSGGGFRPPEKQIELRRKHCGPSDYDIWQKPSSECHPPTARPGRSNHERGLAIDFTYNGRSIKTRNNPGFLWLQANAARFGLRNLASEPWHWSVDGK